MIMKKICKNAVALAMTVVPVSLAYSDDDAPAALLSKVGLCDSCHGVDGVSHREMVPIIAGFSYNGFLDSMNNFREQLRPALPVPDESGEEKAMTTIVMTIGEEEVDALAKHYSNLPFKAAEQDYDPQLAEEGKLIHEEKKCERCHSSGGSDPQDDAAMLAGQWTPYLKRQLEHFKIGRRTIPRKMKNAVDKLSEDQIEALLHFYASNNLSGK